MRKEVKDKLADAKSHGRLESIHLFSQIALNAVTVIAVALGGLWVLVNTVYIKQEQEISSFTLRELRQKTAQAPV